MGKKASAILTLLITGAFVLALTVTAVYRHYTLGVYDVPPPYYSYDGKFNINTATPEMLDLLPGLGTVLSNRIVEYREEHGPFRSTDDLENVKGIGQGTIDKIIDYISTGEIK